MTSKDVLESMGANDLFGSLDFSVELGYEVQQRPVRDSYFGKEKTMVTIHPKQKWTDGTIRPSYSYSWACGKIDGGLKDER